MKRRMKRKEPRTLRASLLRRGNQPPCSVCSRNALDTSHCKSKKYTQLRTASSPANVIAIDLECWFCSRGALQAKRSVRITTQPRTHVKRAAAWGIIRSVLRVAATCAFRFPDPATIRTGIWRRRAVECNSHTQKMLGEPSDAPFAPQSPTHTWPRVVLQPRPHHKQLILFLF